MISRSLAMPETVRPPVSPSACHPLLLPCCSTWSSLLNESSGVSGALSSNDGVQAAVSGVSVVHGVASGVLTFTSQNSASE